MPTALSTQIHLEVAAFLQASSPTEGGAGGRVNVLAQLVNGTSTGQADRVYFAQRSLGPATSEMLDLSGVLADPLGAVLSFAKIKLIAVQNEDTVDGEDLHWGPDATAGWGVLGIVQDASDRRRANAGGLDIWYDPNGHAVTAGSADELYFTTLVGALTYKLLIIGTSA